jgi:predicted O-linked N-acetylglucosamine transferase (SPINDLY family)
VINKSALVTNVLAPAASKFNQVNLEMSVQIMNICLLLMPQDQELLCYLTNFYLKYQNFSKALEVAWEAVAFSKEPVESILAEFALLNALVTAGGMWEQVLSASQRQESLLPLLSAQNLLDLTSHLFITRFFAPYIKDNPKTARTNQNYLSSLCQSRLHLIYSDAVKRFASQNASKLALKESKPIKIGYLSNCLATHSVGWLARWLFQYHDRDQFQIYGYFINYYSDGNDPLQEWFISQTDKAYRVGVELLGSTLEVCEQISRDGIDILVDLDSITYMNSCEILSLKPAPIQVTWLGYDASGIPSIDYFIADPHVLPVEAETYYSEKIWRLPQTYIAIDGFECGDRTLYRSHLDIAEDAVVFFTGQSGYKRHPDNARLQLQIIKNVPNSYLLIKGLADVDSVKNLFYQLAEEEGINISSLRFLPLVKSELEHRANLTIADVVLDTYPYNGATTTLETLWMGIPMVTLVGQQFSARNSYTMMINAGLTEGIAWSAQEYIEWGIKLGIDKQLRKEICQKLKESRNASPLWNARQFAKDMERAYLGMWHLATAKQNQ